MTPKLDTISPDAVISIPAEGAHVRDPVGLAAIPTPSQSDLLRRSLGLSARITHEMAQDQQMGAELRDVLSSVVALLSDWARLSGGLTEEVGGKGDEVTKLREVIATQAHRIEMAEEMLRDMEKLVNIDHLTGAWNTRALEKVGQGLFERMKQSGKSFSCLFIDLDFFKIVNDAYSHEAGDHVLKGLTKTIGEQSRLSDFLFRLGEGSEEFCLLLPETDVDGAATLAERIRDYLEKNPFKYENHNISVTASIGVAEADFSNHSTFEEVKHQSDLAQKVAKTTRNTVVSYHPANGTPESYVDRSSPFRVFPKKRMRYEEVTA